MRKTIAIIILLAVMTGTAAYALPDDIPDFYYDLGPIFFEVRTLDSYHEPGSVMEVDITTHAIRRKVLKDGYHAFICTPSGDFVTYHELHAGEPLPSDYVYPNLESNTTAPPTKTPAPSTPTPSTVPTVDMTGFNGGNQTLGSKLGDISRGNHPLSGVAESPVIVPRPSKSQYDPIQILDTSSIILSDIDGHWAGTEIRRFVEQGYIAGYSDGTFRPDDPVSYAELTTIFARFHLKPVLFTGGFIPIKNVIGAS